MQSTEYIFSVIVCTHNRAKLLALALDSLCCQNYDNNKFQVLVVDNVSEDNTKLLVEQYKSESAVEIIYIYESKIGLSHARNRGMEEAKGKYLAYLDDDAIAPENWLKAADEIVGKINPGCLGGPYYPYYLTEKPKWYLDEFGSRECAVSEGPIDSSNDLSGGNFFIRRDLALLMDGFDPNFGMSGDKIGYGEETHLQKRIFEEHPMEVIYYSPKLQITHYVRPDKMSMRWKIKQLLSSSYNSTRIILEGSGSKAGFSELIKDIFRFIYYFPKEIFFNSLTRDRKKYPFVRSYLYGVGFVPIRYLGRIAATITFYFK